MRSEAMFEEEFEDEQIVVLTELEIKDLNSPLSKIWNKHRLAFPNEMRENYRSNNMRDRLIRFYEQNNLFWDMLPECKDKLKAVANRIKTLNQIQLPRVFAEQFQVYWMEDAYIYMYEAELNEQKYKLYQMYEELIHPDKEVYMIMRRK
jgi:hypothetical protein